MNIKRFVAVVGLLGLVGGAARADNFEDALAKGGEAASAQALKSRADATPYAQTIVCPTPKNSELPENMRLYTRLAGMGPRESLPVEEKDSVPPNYKVKTPKGEPGAELDEILGEGVTRSKLSYVEYSCDTQDYVITFDMDGLVRSTPQKQSGTVKGHAHVETRGYVDFDGDLTCTAYW
jgi:hypothetical protein